MLYTCNNTNLNPYKSYNYQLNHNKKENILPQIPNNTVNGQELRLTRGHIVYFTSNAVLGDKLNNQLKPDNTYIFIGHKSPDTDSICTAMAETYLAKVLGANAVALRSGKLNTETQFVLDFIGKGMKQAGIEPPQLYDKFAEGKDTSKFKVILVDHNSSSQMADGIDAKNIVEIIDHHQIDGLCTNKPISLTVKPVGCTATIVTKMFEENKVPIPRPIAILLLSAIISDTRLFASETTRKEDRETADKLAAIANLNIRDYGMKLLKADDKSKTMTADKIVSSEFKLYKDDTVGIGQIHSISHMVDILKKEKELLEELKKLQQEKGCKYTMLMITEGIEPKPGQKPSTYLLYTDESRNLVQEAFKDIPEKRNFSNNIILLPGVMSRKLSITPKIDTALEKLQ